MKISLPNSLLVFASAACFVEFVRSLGNRNTETLLTLALSVLLLLRGFAVAPQPGFVIISGFVLAALSVGFDEGFLNEDNPGYTALFALAGAAIIFSRHIQKLRKWP